MSGMKICQEKKKKMNPMLNPEPPPPFEEDNELYELDNNNNDPDIQEHTVVSKQLTHSETLNVKFRRDSLLLNPGKLFFKHLYN